MNQGWIKLHRKIWENPRSKDPDWVALWFRILSLASHKETKALFNGKLITLLPGQLITGRKILAKASGCSESKIQRLLSCYESEQQIEQQTTFHSRLITVKNWKDYQQTEQQNEQPVNSYRTASEQPVNTIQELKNERMKEEIVTNVTEQTLPETKKYGKNEINEMLAALKATIKIQAFVDSAIERNMAKHCVSLLAKIGKDEFVRRLECLLAEPFTAKNCNKIKFVYNNIKGFIEPKVDINKFTV